MIQPQAEFLDLYRAGLKSAAELMKTSLESAERLQNQQLAAMRTALEQQTRMVGEQVDRMIGYWASVSQPRSNQTSAKQEPRKSA